MPPNTPVRHRPERGHDRQGHRYLRAALGLAAAAAAGGRDRLLSERYRRPVNRRGTATTLAAAAGSILVIIWCPRADPAAHFRDLGADLYERRVDTTRKTKSLVRQLEALGHAVTLRPAA